VDVIVGFPGETEERFLETYRYIADLDISYLHVFTYSERENTLASAMEDVVPVSVRKKRSKMLRALSARKRRAFYNSQVGKFKKVLFEKDIQKGYLEGFTENYLRVRHPWNPELANKMCNVEIIAIDEEGYARIRMESVED
jgi:threonylcarbamoyladenosine tRNA methylthiotransferase MtaB